MSATGNFVDAATALTWGLVNHVVPHAELMAVAGRLAADVASNDPGRTVQAIFATYREVSQVTGADAAAVERRAHERWHAGGIDRDEVARRRAPMVVEGGSAVPADPDSSRAPAVPTEASGPLEAPNSGPLRTVPAGRGRGSAGLGRAPGGLVAPAAR